MTFLSDKYWLFSEIVKLLSTLYGRNHEAIERDAAAIYVQPLLVWPVRVLHLFTAPNKQTRFAIFEYGKHLLIAFYSNIPIITTKKSRFLEGGEALNSGVASDALHAWRSVQQGLNISVRKLLEEHRGHVLVAGHSTGGALALLEAGYLSQFIPIDRLSCITIGAPKIAGNQFRRKFAAIGVEFYRIVNERDPVPSFPSLFPQLHHPEGTVIELEDDDELVADQPWWRSWFGCSNVRHHHISVYQSGIARLWIPVSNT